jgi:hypothetical protein
MLGSGDGFLGEDFVAGLGVDGKCGEGVADRQRDRVAGAGCAVAVVGVSSTDSAAAAVRAMVEPHGGTPSRSPREWMVRDLRSGSGVRRMK